MSAAPTGVVLPRPTPAPPNPPPPNPPPNPPPPKPPPRPCATATSVISPKQHSTSKTSPLRFTKLWFIRDAFPPWMIKLLFSGRLRFQSYRCPHQSHRRPTRPRLRNRRRQSCATVATPSIISPTISLVSESTAVTEGIPKLALIKTRVSVSVAGEEALQDGLHLLGIGVLH